MFKYNIIVILLIFTTFTVAGPLDYVSDVHDYWLQDKVVERSFDFWVTPARDSYVEGDQTSSYFVTDPQPGVRDAYYLHPVGDWSMWMRHDAGVPPFAWDGQWRYIQQVPDGTTTVKLFCTYEKRGKVNMMEIAKWRYMAYKKLPYNKD